MFQSEKQEPKIDFCVFIIMAYTKKPALSPKHIISEKTLFNEYKFINHSIYYTNYQPTNDSKFQVSDLFQWR